MSKVKTAATAPEIAVRKMLSAAGVRYRLNDRRIAGRPDIHVPRLKTAIFVHGCFWHGHDCVRGALPKTNAEFWREKIERNRMRDERVIEALTSRGVRTLVVWGCEIRRNDHPLIKRLITRYRRSFVE